MTWQDDHSDGDDYVSVEAVAVKATEKAVLLKTEGDVQGWVPRSCLHGADDLFLNKPLVDELHTYRVRGWVARQKGF
jgi:hypothetical protein